MEHVTEECTCEGKECTKCHDVLCVGNYSRDKRLRSGLKSRCRACQNEQNKDWRKNNQEYNSQRKEDWRKNNIEKVLEYEKEYRQNTAERRRAYGQEYDRTRRVRVRKGRKPRLSQEELNTRHRIRAGKYREEHKEEYAQRWKMYYQQYLKGSNNERIGQWRKKNIGAHAAIEAKRRARKTQAGGSYTAQEWRELCAFYGNRCLKCGRSDVKLHADHVIPIAKGGSSDISNIQPLCKSCNSSKGLKIQDFRGKNP